MATGGAGKEGAIDAAGGEESSCSAFRWRDTFRIRDCYHLPKADREGCDDCMPQMTSCYFIVTCRLQVSYVKPGAAPQQTAGAQAKKSAPANKPSEAPAAAPSATNAQTLKQRIAHHKVGAGITLADIDALQGY